MCCTFIIAAVTLGLLIWAFVESKPYSCKAHLHGWVLVELISTACVCVFHVGFYLYSGMKSWKFSGYQLLARMHDLGFEGVIRVVIIF